MALSLAGAVIGVASPVFQKVFVDQLLGSTSVETERLGLDWAHQLSPVAAISFAFVATLLAQGFMLLASYAATREGTILQKLFSEALYKKTLSIRPESMGSTTVGEVVSLYATDVAGSTALIDQVLPMWAAIFFPMVLAPAAVYWITGISPWATLFVMFIIISLTVVLATRQSRFFTRFKQLAAERTGIVNEWVQTIRLLRILGWVESFETKIFNKRREETRNRVSMVTNGQLMNAFGSSINFVINLVGAASLIFFSQRDVTPGELFALLWIFGIFMARSFRQLPWFFTFILDSLTSMRRLEAFMARPSDAGEASESPTSTPALVPAHGESLGLSIRGLNLSIRDQKILEDINLDVRTGEFVAIVGEVGAGKSMFVLSLVGETGATFESFKIGGRDALNLSLDQRRRYFAFVPQEGFVMSASLRENIVFRYEPEASEDAEIEKSLEVAQFRLSEVQGNGLETEIGERGVNLSGGQRQRVSLARAHHFERPLVLLDDCLSAVDVDTERKLLDSLIDGAWREKTRLLITHRLSVLNKVDRIIFLENGRIHDMGTLQELMKRSTKMQEFVASVKKHEAEAASGKEAANGIAQAQPEPIS